MSNLVITPIGYHHNLEGLAKQIIQSLPGIGSYRLAEIVGLNDLIFTDSERWEFNERSRIVLDDDKIIRYLSEQKCKGELNLGITRYPTNLTLFVDMPGNSDPEQRVAWVSTWLEAFTGEHAQKLTACVAVHELAHLLAEVEHQLKKL